MQFYELAEGQINVLT